MRAIACALAGLLGACANHPGPSDGGASPTDEGASSPASQGQASADSSGEGEGEGEGHVADVTAVEVGGAEGAYSFSVTLRSPDTDCERYADWWEVVDAEGALVYRRILAHSHVDEQPFTRSGGPVEVAADAQLRVRAHMQGEGTSTDGYGGQVMAGSVAQGFSAADAAGLAPLHEVPPLPDGCAF